MAGGWEHSLSRPWAPSPAGGCLGRNGCLACSLHPGHDPERLGKAGLEPEGWEGGASKERRTELAPPPGSPATATVRAAHWSQQGKALETQPLAWSRAGDRQGTDCTVRGTCCRGLEKGEAEGQAPIREVPKVGRDGGRQ